MAKAQTLNFPKGASYMIPFQFRSPGNDVGDWTGWRVYFIVKKQLSDPDTAALVNQTIIADPSTGYNELVLSGTETNAYPVGRYFYQATVVDGTGTVGKSEIGAFIVEETTLLSDAGDYEGPDAPVGPPGAGEFTYGAVRPIILDVNIVSTVGMSPGIYDPRHIQADVFDVDNHTDGIVNRVFTAVEQDKLGGIANGATANATDAYLLTRANHTGTQAIATVAGLQSALDSKGDVTALNAHINDKNNPHETTKTQVGLPNVDNTADAVKNVLSATKLTNARQINGVSFDGTANITIADSTKEPILAPGTTGQYYRGDKTWQTLNKAAVGLPNVDNTADSAKPISAAVAAALANKVDKTTTANRLYGTGATGAAELLPYATDPTADTMAKRGAGGALSVGTATDNPHAVPKAQLDVITATINAAKSDKVDTVAVVNHGTNANTGRPTIYGSVIWRGSVEPLYKLPGDIWMSEDGSVRNTTRVENLSTNPRNRRTSGSVEVRRNLTPTPRPRNGSLTGFSSGSAIGGTPEYVANDGPIPSIGWMKQTATIAATGAAAGLYCGSNQAVRTPVTPGTVYNFSLYGYISMGTDRNTQIRLQYFDAAGNTLTAVSSTLASHQNDTWQRRSLTHTAPANAAACRIDFVTESIDWTVGWFAGLTAVMVENLAALMPYFDGEYNQWQPNDLTASWTGAAGTSQSVLTGQQVGFVGGIIAGKSVAWRSTDNPPPGSTHFTRIMSTSTYDTSKGININDASVPIGVRTGLALVRPVGMTTAPSLYSRWGLGNTIPAAIRSYPVDTWTEERQTMTWPVVTSGLAFVYNSSDNTTPTAWGPGTFIDIGDHLNVVGSYSGGYFDGNTPGGVWTDVPDNSTSISSYFASISYLPTTGGTVNGDVVINGTINGRSDLSGIGSPEGNVVAPMGSTYTDLSSALGAYKWRKISGSGATGWRCYIGDTGIRNITPSSLPAGMSSCNLRIQRKNDMIHVWLNESEFTQATVQTILAQMPSGFEPNGTVTVDVYQSNSIGQGTTGTARVTSSPTTGLVAMSSIGGSRVFYASYSAPNSWPATLPGTAL